MQHIYFKINLRKTIYRVSFAVECITIQQPLQAGEGMLLRNFLRSSCNIENLVKVSNLSHPPLPSTLLPTLKLLVITTNSPPPPPAPFHPLANPQTSGYHNKLPPFFGLFAALKS